MAYPLCLQMRFTHSCLTVLHGSHQQWQSQSCVTHPVLAGMLSAIFFHWGHMCTADPDKEEGTRCRPRMCPAGRICPGGQHPYHSAAGMRPNQTNTLVTETACTCQACTFIIHTTLLSTFTHHSCQSLFDRGTRYASLARRASLPAHLAIRARHTFIRVA